MEKRAVRWQFRIAFILSIFTAMACNRHGEDKTMSIITIASPGHLRNQLPAGRVACYGINIKGKDLTSVPASSCAPEMGITGGFVKAGAEISAAVPKGKVIDVELYAFIEPTGVTAPCPTFDGGFNKTNISNVYLVGKAKGVSVDKDEVQVNISQNYTGQNVIASNSLPATCASNNGFSNGQSNFHIDAGRVHATGTGFQMNARVGATRTVNTMTGSGYKLLVR
jgi:hypothetical protein